jgi:hypothetical protein
LIPVELVATLATTLLFSLSPTPPDTLDGIRRINRLLRDHYGTRIVASPSPGYPRGAAATSLCDAGKGGLCHGGDPDRGYCPLNVYCHRTEEWLVRGLVEEAGNHPTSGFLTGQAVYALTKFGYVPEAARVVEGCRAEEWWCQALRGYLLHARGRMADAEISFRKAFSGAPPPTLCAWGDAFWLLGEWDQGTAGLETLPGGREATSDWTCLQRLAASDTLFWWGDPLLSDAVNDRWTEHIARAMASHFYVEIQRARWGADVPQRYRNHDWAMRIRRGPWDSYRAVSGMSRRFWTSLETAYYRFIPDVMPGDFSQPVWSLEGDPRFEGYTPDYGPLHVAPVQVARFRAGETLRVAAAASLAATPLSRATSASAHLVLSDGPGSVPVQAEKEVQREAPTFLVDAKHRDYVLGFEAFTRIGIGWHRELLYHASGAEDPGSLPEAVEIMLGSTALEEPGEIGVFWEVYGAQPEGDLSFEMTLEREAGGLVDRLAAFLPGGSQEGRGRVAWTEPATGETHPRAIILDLSGLDGGEYALVLQVRWPGHEPLERRRRLRVGRSD